MAVPRWNFRSAPRKGVPHMSGPWARYGEEPGYSEENGPTDDRPTSQNPYLIAASAASSERPNLPHGAAGQYGRQLPTINPYLPNPYVHDPPVHDSPVPDPAVQGPSRSPYRSDADPPTTYGSPTPV